MNKNKKPQQVMIPPDLLRELQHISHYERANDFNTAFNLTEKLLINFGRHVVVLQYLGVLSLKLGQPQKALQYFQQAIKQHPEPALLYNLSGVAYCQLGNLEKGILSYQKALKLNSKFAETYYNLAIAQAQKNNIVEAEQNFRNAIRFNFISPDLFYNLGNVLHQQNKIEEAIACYQKTLELDSTHLNCAYNLSDLLIQKRLDEQAIAVLKHILKLQDSGVIKYQIGLLSYDLGNYQEAINYFNEGLRAEPVIFAYQLLGNSYRQIKDYDSELKTYQEGLVHFPKSVTINCYLVSVHKFYCNWDQIDSLISVMREGIDTESLFEGGFYLLLGFEPSKELQFARKNAEFYSAKVKKVRSDCHFSWPKKKKSKLRIGYVTSDLRNHPGAHLTRNMFSFHNREQFEIFLYSTAKRDESIYAKHIPQTADHFVDLYGLKPEVAAKRIFNDQIDILLNTSGYHRDSPAAIFEIKPAPIQISFLGYCGTTGSEFMDYMVTDRHVLPPEEEVYYTEKLIYMPHTYFVTDDEAPVAPDTTREEQGLPKDAIVFCCFNQHTKYESRSFSIWMRILEKISRAVLWLWVHDEKAQANLRREAARHGISPERLIFALDFDKDRHLARIKLADLFLDTFACTAHTTSIDALWVGLPVISCFGNNIASRGASSVLKAIGLSELITKTPEEYEEKILYYANHPSALLEIRKKIEQNKKTMPLFNTKLYIKNLEAGFLKAWENYLQNDKQHIFINP